MKTAQEKAAYWLNDNVAGWTTKQAKCLATLLKEQDRDTRHAGAMAVNDLHWWCGEDNECTIDRGEAFNAIMNVKAV